MNQARNRWEDWLIYGGPMPHLGEDWPVVPPVEGFNSFDDEETDGEG